MNVRSFSQLVSIRCFFSLFIFQSAKSPVWMLCRTLSRPKQSSLVLCSRDNYPKRKSFLSPWPSKERPRFFLSRLIPCCRLNPGVRRPNSSWFPKAAARQALNPETQRVYLPPGTFISVASRQKSAKPLSIQAVNTFAQTTTSPLLERCPWRKTPPAPPRAASLFDDNGDASISSGSPTARPQMTFHSHF